MRELARRVDEGQAANRNAASRRLGSGANEAGSLLPAALRHSAVLHQPVRADRQQPGGRSAGL